MIYFKFNNLEEPSKDSSNFFYKLLESLLKLIIPKSNPDYNNDVYDEIKIWFIEYDDINDYANREIGLDENNQVVLISPHNENLGVWTDEDLSLLDYKKFNVNYSNEDEFNKLWSTFLDSIIK